MVEIFENIRKIYLFSAPCGELADYIDFYSQSCPDATARSFSGIDFTVKMFASYTPTFWINLGNAYQLSLDNKLYTIRKNEDILVVRDGLAERFNQPDDQIFTVKFFPGALENIFGLSQSKMIGKPIPLHHILPYDLLQQIKAAPGFEERIGLMQQFLLLKASHKKSHDHFANIVRQSIGLYVREKLQPNVNELAEKTFVTSKTINRYFNNVVGTSPKHYFSILRSRTALTAYVNNRLAFDPTEYGYYDMSHFHKEASRFTGDKLSAVLV